MHVIDIPCLLSQYLFESLNEDVGHNLETVIIGVKGYVVAEVAELALPAAFGKEVGNRERLIGCYLAYDIGILLQVDAVLGIVPVVRQITVETVCLSRGAEDDSSFGVTGEDAVDNLSVVGCEGAVLRVVDVVLDCADGRGVAPIVDTVLDGVVVGIDYRIDGR